MHCNSKLLDTMCFNDYSVKVVKHRKHWKYARWASSCKMIYQIFRWFRPGIEYTMHVSLKITKISMLYHWKIPKKQYVLYRCGSLAGAALPAREIVMVPAARRGEHCLAPRPARAQLIMITLTGIRETPRSSHYRQYRLHRWRIRIFDFSLKE